MKKTISQRVMALALAACLVLGMIPGLASKAEALTNQWRGIATAETYIVAEANDPFNVAISNTGKAYYNKKIDVVTGTKISFNVNFSAYQADAAMQYTFSLVDQEGCVYQNGSANALSAELSSAVGANVRAVSSYKNSSSNRTFCTNILNSASSNIVDSSRNTDSVYAITFEKLAETEANSWKISVNNGTDDFTTLIATEKIAHDLFQNGAYLAVGNMTSATGHVVNVSDLVVVQPNVTTNWKTISKNSNAALGQVNGSTFDATITNHITGYYNQKINVKEGTTVSFRVAFPAVTDGANLQYSFSLVDRAGSFYVSNTTANSISLELASVSTVANGALTAGAAKKFTGATSRTLLGYLTSGLANPRNTTDVYDVTFKKINETISDVNYSWVVTLIKNGTTPYSYRYKASDVPHDLFENGAYFAMGSMAQFNTHTVKVSDFLVNNSWSSVAPAGTVIPGRDLVPESANSFDASFRNKSAGYYDRKIHVEEGTKISMKAKLVATTTGVAMWFGVSLTDKPNAFYNVDTTANALTVELGNGVATTTNMPSVVSRKIPGGGSNNRIWTANVGTLAGSRATNMIYTITFEKLAASEANSWKVTVNNGATDFTALIGTDKVAHDMLGEDLYIAAGFMSAVNGHNIDLFDVSVTQPDAAAAVDTVEYSDFKMALDNAFAGETVELKKDLALTEALDLANTDVTLDIGSNTVSGTTIATLGAGTDLTVVSDGGSLTGKLELTADGAKITSDCAIAVEMNGNDATVNASNVTLTDSATDNGTVGGKIYGNCTVADRVSQNGVIRYVILDSADGTYKTANAVRVKVNGVNIRPSEAGMYYTTEVKFNQNVADAGAEYGVVLSLADKPGADFATEETGENYPNRWTKFEADTGADFSKVGTSCLITNILKNDGTSDAENGQRGAMNIYANAYVKLTVDGQEIVIMMENAYDVVYSMQSVMNKLDQNLATELQAYAAGTGELSATAQKAVNFFETWQGAMTQNGWSLTNMAAALAKKNAA